METAESRKDDILQLKSLIRSLKGVNPPKDSAKAISRRIDKMELRIEQLSKLKAGEPCPLCDHKVSSKHAHDLKKMERELVAEEALRLLAEQVEERDALLKSLPKNLLRYREDTYEKELKAVDDKIVLVEKAIDCEGEVERITGALEEINVPDTAPPKVTDEDIEKIENGIEHIKDSVTTLENNLRLLEKIERSGNTLSYKDAKKP